MHFHVLQCASADSHWNRDSRPLWANLVTKRRWASFLAPFGGCLFWRGGLRPLKYEFIPLIATSRIAFYYSQPSILPAPIVPKPFDGSGIVNVNVSGRLYDESSSTIPLVPGINTINCALTELWNELMQYICGATVKGSDSDLRIRKKFYCKILDYVAQLPPRFRFGSNMTPTTCFTRCVCLYHI